ncbi:MFS transporter [Tsukamurella soli]|uniref:MFS transporter n=1 Tax=Tsukamurella soli TaxID=644556 RepID=A0ABP8JEA8_9ACTN
MPTTDTPPAIDPAAPRPTRFRWTIVGLFGAYELINYLDRINLSVAGPIFADHLRISPTALGIAFSAFLWSYALMQIPSGILLDRIGVRWICRILIPIWALASLLTAVANGLGLVIISRLVLGVSEAPAFPSAMKATANWFPRVERGMATAMFSAPSRLSNVIGAPLVGLAVGVWGWRGAFIATGILSLVFAVVFWLTYREPADARRTGRLSPEEYDYITDGGAHSDATRGAVVTPALLWYLLRQRKVVGLSLGLACAGYMSWMLLTWLPGFFQKELGTSVAKSGVYTAVPWAFAFVLEMTVAGWLVDALIKRGLRETTVRRGVLIGGMLLACTVGLMGVSHSLLWSLTWITVGTVGIAISFSVSNSIPALIAPPGAAATVGSIMNFVNAMAGIAAPIVTGVLLQKTGTFTIAFLVAAVILVIGVVLYTVVLGAIEPVPAPVAGDPAAKVIE